MTRNAKAFITFVAAVFAALLAILVPIAVMGGMTVGPGIAAHTHADANTGGILGLVGSLTSTKACAAQFTREGPNFCRHTGTLVTTASWVDATACTQRNFGGALPADAKAVQIAVDAAALSNNAVADRQNSVSFFGNTSCTGGNGGFLFYDTREQVAVVAGTLIGEIRFTLDAPLCATDTICMTQANAGGNGNVDIQSAVVAGYWD